MIKRTLGILSTEMVYRRRGAGFISAQRIAVALVAVGVGSCGGGADSSSAPPSPGILVGGGAPVAVCSGADLSNLTSAVYVSTAGTDGAGCGQTTKTACQTLQQGIANCAASGCGVIVRHGLYPTTATIVLRDGVDVYGGCRFDGETDRRYRTVIQASPPPGTPAARATGIGGPTTVHGLVVIGKDEMAGGTASIAMSVSDSTGLTLTGSVLWAGTGGDAARGHDGIPGIPVPGPNFCGQAPGVANANIWGELTETSWTPSSGGPGSQDAAGGGGSQGGASIALVLANATLPGLAEQNAVLAGIGGRGGNGGAGGVRQASGSPFVAGAGGAGGNGGASITVALTGGSAAPASGDGIYPGRSALGGVGGTGGIFPGCQAATGADGFGGAVADIVSMQSLPKNLLTTGQRLQAGDALWSTDGNTSFWVLLGSSPCVFDYATGGGGCTYIGPGGIHGVVLRADGKLCMWTSADPNREACTDTAGHPGAYLLVRNGGSTVLIDGPIVLWSLP